MLFQIQGAKILDFLKENAQLPLPPYITYEKEKEQRYQTHFAKYEGSAAAPTASLHFTPEVMQKLEEKNIKKHFLTLHIGLGTFKPLLEQDITQYNIHSEEIIIPKNIFSLIAQYKISQNTNKKDNKNRIIPVGTTMIRSLESLPFLYQQLKCDNKIYLLNLTAQEQDFRENLTIAEQEFIQSYTITKDQETISFETKLYIYP